MALAGIVLFGFALAPRAHADRPTAIASYRIEATLDPGSHRVTGKQTLQWTNRGPQPVREIVLHLYMNAFASTETRFGRETGGRHRAFAIDASAPGKIEIGSIRRGAVDLTKALVVDETLARLALDTPVAPGATLSLDVDFVTTLPKIAARTGYADRFVAVGQWFPKIAVYECPLLPGCGFVAQQLHAATEFFADFGDYDVTVDVPAAWVVAGCGVRVRDEVKGDRRRVTFAQQNIHDFSWFASPDFSRFTDRVVLGEREVELELFAGRDMQAGATRHLEATKRGLTILATQLVPYPYPKLTIVLPPHGAEGAGGMEYPTLITGFAAPAPDFVRFEELVTLHELAHEYFYGLVATNEPEEAWLDEGLTEFVSSRIVDEHYDGIFALGPLRVAMSVSHWLSAVQYAAFWPIAIPAYAYPLFVYGAATYGKTAAVLQLWQERVGRAELDTRLRNYVATQQFRHPRRADFVAAMARTNEERALLDALLSLDQPIDYAIEDVDCTTTECRATLHHAGPALDDVILVATLASGAVHETTWSVAQQRAAAGWRVSLPTGVVQLALRGPILRLDLHPRNDTLRVHGDPRARDLLARFAQVLATTLLALVGP